MRGVGGAEGQVEEERAIGSDAAGVRHHRQRLIDEILRQVVAVLRPAGRFDGMVVADQLGMELVGLPVEEPVETVEAARQRPLIEWAGRRALLHWREVPLPDAERGVSLLAEHLGDGGRLVGDMAELVGKAGAEIRHRPHAGRMLGSAGQQRRPGRGAQRCHVEIAELQSVRGQRVDVPGVDIGAVAAQLREAGVIQQDDHHVGGTGRGVRRLVEPGLGVGQRSADDAFESGLSGHKTSCSHGRRRAEGWTISG